MTLTLQLHSLLPPPLARASRDLLTRPTGVAVRMRIERAMADAGSGMTLLDFEFVGILDFSCADEIVAKLLHLADTDRYVVLAGVDDVQAEAIHHVLERQQLAILALPRGGGRRLLGLVTPDMEAVFDAAHRNGPGTAEALAGHLDWAVERTANVLQSLALRRLLVADGGTFTPLPLP